MSATIRFTSGRVRLASARVKYFLGTETIYAEMLSPDDYYSLDKLRMRNKSHDSFVAVHYHDRRSNMRVRLFQLLDLEPRQLRLRCHHHRVAPRVHLGGALLRVVPRRHTLRHDVAVGDGAEVTAALWVFRHPHDPSGPCAHQQRPPPPRG